MRPRLVVLLAVICLSIGSRALGQDGTAVLRGRVLDAQKAPVPGATLTITNQATRVVRHTVSNADGTYFITSIAPGLYVLEAQLSGFSKYSRRDVRLDRGRTATVDVQLSVGQRAGLRVQH